MILIFLIFFLSAAFLIYRHFTWQALPWPKEALVPPQYQGHRGYWVGGLPENTLLAFEAAEKNGFKMVEMDVRLTEDKVPVVFHDCTLKRIFNLDKKVDDCTVEELRIYGIPTLEEVLNSKSIPPNLNIELKNPFIFDSTLEEKVAALIKNHKAEGRVVISSFNPLALKRMSSLLPDVPRALLATEEAAPDNRIYLRKLWLAPYVRVHALHLDHRYVSAELIKKWKKRNIPVAVWTVNDRKKAESFLNAGALSVISDYLS
ncbi:MAG: glycerophosphodiester phosphodiesterase [Bdellovibrio sp.]